STRAAAEAVAAELRARGLEVSLTPAAEVRGLGDHGLVVLGTALYMGRWHRDVRGFLARHRGELAGREVALFVLGPVRSPRDDGEWRNAQDQTDKELARASRGCAPWPLGCSAAASTPRPCRSRSTAWPPRSRRLTPSTWPPSAPGRASWSARSVRSRSRSRSRASGPPRPRVRPRPSGRSAWAPGRLQGGPQLVAVKRPVPCRARERASACSTEPATSGNPTVATSPPPSRGARVRAPPCARQTLLTIARPRPTPAWPRRTR